MEKLLDTFIEVLRWIQDSPFRLVAALSLSVAVLIFFFFRRERASYKVIATTMLMAGIGAIAYSKVFDSSRILPDPIDDTLSAIERTKISYLNRECAFEVGGDQSIFEYISGLSKSSDDHILNIQAFHRLNVHKESLFIEVISGNKRERELEVDVLKLSRAEVVQGNTFMINFYCNPTFGCVRGSEKTIVEFTLVLKDQQCSSDMSTFLRKRIAKFH